MLKALLRLAAVRDTKQAGELRGDTVHFIASSSARFLWCKTQHLSTIKTDGDLSFTIIPQQTYRRKQPMDQPDDNSLTALLTKREEPARLCEIVNTCTERREEKRKRIQRTAWILSHVLRETLCEHVNGLCPAGKLNEQSIIQPWFQSVRTCPYGWPTGCNTIASTKVAITGCNVTPAQDGYTWSVQDWAEKLQCSAKSTCALQIMVSSALNRKVLICMCA